jgi:ATP-dependent RNA helicase HelY
MAKRHKHKLHIPVIRPRADPRLADVLATIGTPEPAPFQPDPFQMEALAAIEHSDCLVTAPTGAGKTWIAERAMARMLQQGKKSWYASPLKALSNSKHAEFSAIFPGQVGILTGDRKENADAPIIVGTTEILRNQLYDAMHHGQDLSTDLVILDEVHFMGDKERGVVWEEIMIYLPRQIPLLMLSATIGNADQIAGWLSAIRDRECAVVEETRRPVDLSLLFFHPSGLLLPLLWRSKKGRQTLYKRVKAYVQDKNPPRLSRPRELPPFGEILRVLRTYDLLPAIFFLKSRSDCDQALRLVRPREEPQNARLNQRIDELLLDQPHLSVHRQLWHLRSKSVGAHHGGQLPAWKLLLEGLMTEGLLEAIFATSTVSAGVNFPARSVVFINSDRYDGHDFVPLTPTEFHQMVGRAGRRGMDRIGFAIILPDPFMDVQAIAKLSSSPPSDVLSQVKVSFSMILNLLLSHTPAQIRDLLGRSFAAYVAQETYGHPGTAIPDRASRALLRDLNRHLAFLQERGYVTRQGTLTETGMWASQLRVDQPLLIAEGLRLDVLPRSDPALLAAIMASFVDEKETDDQVQDAWLPKKLEQAFVTARRSLRALVLHMQRRGFDSRPLFLRPAAIMYAWANGESWANVVYASDMAEGDLAMLITRTADNLRHIRTLGPVFPQIAVTARRAIDLIVRPPVAIEYE